MYYYRKFQGCLLTVSLSTQYCTSTIHHSSHSQLHHADSSKMSKGRSRGRSQNMRTLTCRRYDGTKSRLAEPRGRTARQSPKRSSVPILGVEVATGASLLRRCGRGGYLDITSLLEGMRRVQQDAPGAHCALCPHCAKSRLFSTTGSHGSGGGSLRDQIFFFLLRTALKDRPKGPPTANRQLPSTANRHQPPTTNRHQPPATNRHRPPAATNRQLPTTANRLQPPTANHQPPPTASCQLPTANRQPPTATNHG